MITSPLLILVEGADDMRFFERIIVPPLKRKFTDVKIWPYSKVCKERVKSFIKSIISMNGEYILVADIDSLPCVSEKKGWICEKYDTVDPKKIVIVVSEIESWYLCGIKPEDLRKIGIRNDQCKKIDNKNCVTKEQFEKIIPESSTRTNFLISVLDLYDLQRAKNKNPSLNYFYENWLK